MKKQLVASLAAAMVLGVAGTSFAAVNPFSDVPAKHWSYDSVNKLQQAGIVDGSNGQFQGDRQITRYEMAQVVAKAMARSDKADASQKAAIDKLSVEFASELESMNVRITNVEKKIDNVKYTGELRTRYDHVKTGDVTADNKLIGYLEMNVTAKVNKDWTVGVRSEVERDLHSDSKANENGTYKTTRAYVTGPVAGANLTMGRFGDVIGTGLVIDDNVTGAKVEFGNLLKVKMLVASTDAYADSYYATNKKVSALQLNYDLSGATSALASYQKWEDKSANALDAIKVWDLGLKTKFATDYTLFGSYAKGTKIGKQDHKAYIVGVNYKAADKAVEGSYGMYAHYENMKGIFGLTQTYDLSQNQKGYILGASYVPAENIVLGARYMDYKDQTTDVKSKAIRAQAEFFF